MENPKSIYDLLDELGKILTAIAWDAAMPDELSRILKAKNILNKIKGRIAQESE